MVRVSHKLRHAILAARATGRRQYQISAAAGLHPTVASALIWDIRPIHERDPRVIALGRAVGVAPDDCFEERPE